MTNESVFVILLFVTLLFGRNEAFIFDRPSQIRSNPIPIISFGNSYSSSSYSSLTSLKLHRFNGGYDPASPLRWTPQEAAEFTIFHQGEPLYIGLQLRMAIQRWTGTDLAEFLTRLYLGQKVEAEQHSSRFPSLSPATLGEESKHRETKSRIVYEPRNVRTPKWKGLETREGVLALKELLKEALSPDTMDSREIARFAEVFLLKEYKWPNQNLNSTIGLTPINLLPKNNGTARKILFEGDSFYTQGHSRTIARILLWIRKERSTPFKWEDIVVMVTLLEHEHKEARPMQLKDFYETLVAHIPLTTKEKTRMVERLALGGWSSSDIPKFMAMILPEDSQKVNTTMLEDGLFRDIPSAAERDAQNERVSSDDDDDENEEDDQFRLETTEEQVLLVSRLKRATLSLRSEYDQLVQSYWKQLERPNGKKNLAKDNKRNSKRGNDASRSSAGNAVIISQTARDRPLDRLTML
jgi:hypothetical protein